MAKLEIKDSSLTFEITSTTPILVVDQYLITLLLSINKFNDFKPLSSMSVVRDSQNVQVYIYTFSAADGEEWQQTMTFDADFNMNPRVAFAVPAPGIRLNVTRDHLIVTRDQIVQLISRYQFSSLEVKW